MAEAKIRITAEDRTPEGFRSVERRLREFSASAAAFQSRLSTIFGGLGTAIGVGAISNLAQAAIKAGIESEQAGARLDIVLRNLGDSSSVTKERVEQLADELSRVGRFDDDDIKSAAAELLKFGDVSAVVFEDALRAAKGVAAFFNDDLRSAAQKVGKALAEPEAAFKLLKEVGVAFTASQKEAIKTLGETQGVAAQQQVIVGELAKRYGDLDKELSGGLTGTIEELNKAWSNLLESFGLTVGKLTPISLAFRGLADTIKAIQSQVDSVSRAPNTRPLERLTPIDEVIPRAPSGAGARSQVFLPGSRTPISEIIPRDAPANATARPTFRPAPIPTEDERRRLQASAGPARTQIILPGAKTGKEDDKSKKSPADSNFQQLRRSLTTQLNQERQLTTELKLVEDERFSSLSKNQQQSLVTLARRIDLITEEKTAQEIVDQSSSVSRSIEESALRNELDIIERRKTTLLQDFEDRKIGVQEYYAFVAAEDDNAFDAQLRNLEALRQAQLEIASDAGSNDRGVPNRSIQERLEATAQIAAIEQQITQLTRDREDNVAAVARAARDAEFAQLEEQIRLTQQLNDLQGRSNIDLDREALLFQFRDLSREIQDSLTFRVFIDATLAEQQFSQFERRVQQIQSARQVREQSADISRQSGTLNQGEFQSAVVEIRKQSIAQIQEEISKLEELAQANDLAFGPEQITRLQALKNELAELGETTDEYLNSVKEASQSEFVEFFDSIISGSASAEDAIKRLGDSIKANLTRKLSESITDDIFAALSSATKENGGLTGLLRSFGTAVSGFLGGGQTQQQGISFDGAVNQGGGLGLSFGSEGQGAQQASAALSDLSSAAAEGSASVSGFSQGLSFSSESADLFSSTLESSAPDVGQSMADLAISTTAAEVGNQSLSTSSSAASIGAEALATSTTDAAIQIQSAARTAAASSAAGAALADGGVFSGGRMMAFAKGGAFLDGQVQPFAVGGIVGGPTTFPIADGRTGLMGEAGPEAIMPLTRKGGTFAVYAIDDDGNSTSLALARDSRGRLAVRASASSSSGATAFALGGIFDGASVREPVRFASGGIFESGVGGYGVGSRPDAFVPLPDGRTVPINSDDDSRGGDIYVTQNITTPDVSGFARTKNQIAAELRAALGTASRRM